MMFRATTFPLAAAVPPAAGVRYDAAIGAKAALACIGCAIAVAGAMTPDGSHAVVQGVLASIGVVFAWWSSIVLASLPYVTVGAIAAALVDRMPRRNAALMAIAVAVAPGCDCSGTGYARAFARVSPAIAGFALVWSAAAGPAALFATHAALGTHIVFARLVGALCAASLTAAMWTVDRAVHRDSNRAGAHACRPLHIHPTRSVCGRIAEALGALALSASIATVAVAAFGHAVRALSAPLAAAAAGALVSPCSTADAVIARVLVHQPSSDVAFVLAAQTLDVRQLSTFARVFSVRRAALAAFAGAAGCFVGAMFAR